MFLKALVVFALTLCFRSLIGTAWPFEPIKPIKPFGPFNPFNPFNLPNPFEQKKKTLPPFNPNTFEIRPLLGAELFLDYYPMSDLIERAPFVIYGDLVLLDKAASMLYEGTLKNPYKSDTKFMQALRLFQTLKTVDYDQEKCNKRSYQILHENFVAAFGYKHWGYQKELAHRKINKAIARLRHFHAENLCKGVYLPKWEKLSKTIEPAHLKLAEFLLEQVVAYHKPDEAQEILSNSTKVFNFTHEYAMTFRIVNHSILVLKVLNELAKDDLDVKYLLPVHENGKFEVNQAKLKQIYNKYLLDPCSAVYHGLEDVFKPAEMDIELTNDILEDRLDYHKAWAAYDACERVHGSQLTIIYHVEDYLNRTQRGDNKKSW